jgi:hypothetical protein
LEINLFLLLELLQKKKKIERNMSENEDLGRGIIHETMGDLTNEKEAREELLKWIEDENKNTALEIGFHYNPTQTNNHTPQEILNEQFGRGFLCAVAFMDEILKFYDNGKKNRKNSSS